MASKELIRQFYQSNAFVNAKTMGDYLHREVELEWNSSRGYLKLFYDDIVALSKEMGVAYTASDIIIKDIIEGEEKTVVRYSHFVKTYENPNESMLLANFIVIWQIKDGKLYKGYQMSQFE